MLESLERRYRGWRSRRVTRRDCHSELARLRRVDHRLAEPLAKAIADTVDRRLDPAAREQFERIEGLRDTLARSSATIDHVDFGAGDPKAPRGLAEARKGVAKTTPVSRLATHTSKSRPWSDLLYNLVRDLKPRKCLEMGTCIGLSAAYQCAAMARDGDGRLVTLEGGPGYAELARTNLRSLGFVNFDVVVGPFEETLGRTLEKERPVDFVFNDGHHDGDAMLAYFDETVPYLADGSVVLFDDIKDYESMREGWRRLVRHPTVDLSVDFGSMGLVCIGREAAEHTTFTMPLA